MFIIKLLSQHVSGIIMPIIRRTRHIPSSGHNTLVLTDIRIRYQSNTTAYIYIHTTIHIHTRHRHTHGIHIHTRPYTYTHETPTMFTSHYSTQRFYGSHLTGFPPPVTVQNTICSNTRSCSLDDGHNNARNMLR